MDGHAIPNHIHLCLSIPPKYSVANAGRSLEGLVGDRIHREYLGWKKQFTDRIFWRADTV